MIASMALMLCVMMLCGMKTFAADASQYAPVFDPTYYATNNPDVAAAYGNSSDLLLKHFISNGMKEGRQASAEFNVYVYINNYPDLQRAFGKDLKKYYLHYIEAGKKEGRIAFDSTKQGTQQVAQLSPTSTVQEQVLQLVNEQRRSNGLCELSATDSLEGVADKRAIECVQTFAHTRPNGTSCFTAFDEYGVSYGYAGENIAKGYIDAIDVMCGWMNSSGHRANILNGAFRHIGVGHYKDVWVQVFTD